MGDVNQDDIDKLLQDAAGGGAPAAAPAPAPIAEEERGPASQDDIDALFAAVGGTEPAATAAPAPAAPAPVAAAPAPTPAPAAPPSTPAADLGIDLEGIAGQDDIDALFAAVGGAEPAATAAPAPAAPAPAASAPGPDLDLDLAGVAGQDDIDALFAAAGGAPAPDEAAPAPAPAEPAPTADAATDTDDVDLDALLREVSEAAPPPPPPPPPRPAPEAIPDELFLPEDALEELPAVAGPVRAPAPTPAPVAPVPAPLPSVAMPPPAYAPPPAASQGEMPPRKEFSVLYGAGEVESVANQIGTLISAMSEKAHGYMQAWIAADSEAKELRQRALSGERRQTTLENEKAALAAQMDELRAKTGELEGAKLAGEESRRTMETSFQAKIRELESQISLLTSESDALKTELTRARNEATGIDIEARRVRFETDRLKNEVESERMERLRMQRALENREKELQAAQAQSSGQASSLFIDELHRLVRRLESELDARASGAHDALRQLDRIEVAESMTPVVANIRAALMQALGASNDADDAIRSLGRDAQGVKGPGAVAAGKAELISFETALSTYNLTDAIDVAGALLREAKATPGVLMRKIYQCPALRRPEVSDRLADAARLLEGLRTVQEAGDRSRGQETGESEVFYVHMFDYLHNLVRLKLINRMSGEIWRLFLDLRGRFSFVTSDRQWAEYRDNTLKSAKSL